MIFKTRTITFFSNSLFMNVPQNTIVSIEGNIGSGKSTVLNILRKRFGDNERVVFVDEPVKEWGDIRHEGKSVLEWFYHSKEVYSFTFQVLTYITRLRKILQVLENSVNKVIICERSIYTDKHVFAQMLYEQKYINEIEWKTYNYWFGTFEKQTQIDHIIYIQTPPETCMQRIQTRARKGESVIPLDYLQHCDLLHERWLHNSDTVFFFNGNTALTSEKEYSDPIILEIMRILDIE